MPKLYILDSVSGRFRSLRHLRRRLLCQTRYHLSFLISMVENQCTPPCSRLVIVRYCWVSRPGLPTPRGKFLGLPQIARLANRITPSVRTVNAGMPWWEPQFIPMRLTETDHELFHREHCHCAITGRWIPDRSPKPHLAVQEVSFPRKSCLLYLCFCSFCKKECNVYESAFRHLDRCCCAWIGAMVLLEAYISRAL